MPANEAAVPRLLNFQFPPTRSAFHATPAVAWWWRRAGFTSTRAFAVRATAADALQFIGGQVTHRFSCHVPHTLSGLRAHLTIRTRREVLVWVPASALVLARLERCRRSRFPVRRHRVRASYRSFSAVLRLMSRRTTHLPHYNHNTTVTRIYLVRISHHLDIRFHSLPQSAGDHRKK
jgi:hypothetical protein